MDLRHILDGLVLYACLLPLITMHEFAHAWTAWKCGDETARLQGRVTVNPLAHMELVGTVLLPLVTIFMSDFLFGWGRPVPVNPYNLRHRRRDDTLISVAGPAMNLLIGIGVLAVARLAQLADSAVLLQACLKLAEISLILCFFNMLPIPPLDGSHVLKNAIGMSDETYIRLAQYGFLLVIIALRIPVISTFLTFATYGTMGVVARVVGLA